MASRSVLIAATAAVVLLGCSTSVLAREGWHARCSACRAVAVSKRRQLATAARGVVAAVQPCSSLFDATLWNHNCGWGGEGERHVRGQPRPRCQQQLQRRRRRWRGGGQLRPAAAADRSRLTCTSVPPRFTRVLTRQPGAGTPRPPPSTQPSTNHVSMCFLISSSSYTSAGGAGGQAGGGAAPQPSGHAPPPRQGAPAACTAACRQALLCSPVAPHARAAYVAPHAAAAAAVRCFLAHGQCPSVPS